MPVLCRRSNHSHRIKMRCNKCGQRATNAKRTATNAILQFCAPFMHSIVGQQIVHDKRPRGGIPAVDGTCPARSGPYRSAASVQNFGDRERAQTLRGFFKESARGRDLAGRGASRASRVRSTAQSRWAQACLLWFYLSDGTVRLGTYRGFIHSLSAAV